MKTILLGLFLWLPLGVSLVSTVLFVLHSRRDGHWEGLARAFGNPWRPTLRALVLGTASMVLAVLLFPLRLLPLALWSRLSGPGRADPDGPGPSVIFVHGLFHNATAWFLYRRVFAARGMHSLFFLEYNSLTAEFAEIEARLAALVEEAATARPGRPVVLVGHSLGGLLSRAVAGRPEAARHLAGIVTLATPHRGSDLGRLGLSRLARSLDPGSGLMRALAARPVPAEVPGLAVLTPTDNLVLPNASAEPPIPEWERHQTPPLGHVDLLYHLPTARLAASFALRASRG